MDFDEFRTVLEGVLAFFRQGFLSLRQAWEVIPSPCKQVILLVLLVAWINVLASLIRAICRNKGKWKPLPDTELMYSFFNGSSAYHRRHVFRDTNAFVLDRKWSPVSFAGLAYRLGNVESPSKILAFLASLVYLPLAVLGMLEMVFRFISSGIVFFLAVYLIWICFLLAGGLLNMLLKPLFFFIDRSTWVKQHCPEDYAEFRLPTFACPHCGRLHKKLYPGRSGLLVARCACGRFIPCSFLTGRKKLSAYCPKCGHELATGSAVPLTLQIIGGNSSGKTAFIAAFQHVYLSSRAVARKRTRLYPQESFAQLEKMYGAGATHPSSPNTVSTYSIVHKRAGINDKSLVLYDTPDELIMSGEYEKNPLNFGYSDAVVLILDPLSTASVRRECEELGQPQAIEGYSDDDAEALILQFINKYSEIAGRAAKKRSSIPVAVVVAKADVTAIRRRIGMVKIRAELAANKGYRDISEARDKICRAYLSSIGLSNALNNLEGVFASVSYFPVSAIGHIGNDGIRFDPFNVIEPIEWIAGKCQSSLKRLLNEAKKDDVR